LHSPHVDDRFLAFAPVQALTPELRPDAIDPLHQLNYSAFTKPPGEIPGGGRVRDALNSQAVHEHFIVAPQFNIIKTRTTSKGVVSNIQNMVRLVIRQVPLEKVHLLINGIHKTALADKQVKNSDSTTINRTHPLGHLIMNVLCSQQGVGLLRPLRALKALCQILFTLTQDFAIFFASLETLLSSVGFFIGKVSITNVMES
jgi:hypothetical protein